MTTHHDALASSYNIMGGWDWEETINNILMKHYNNGIQFSIDFYHYSIIMVLLFLIVVLSLPSGNECIFI